VQHLHAGVGDRLAGLAEGDVETLRAERAAEDEQHLAVWVKTERRERLVAQGGAVEAGDLPPQRHAQYARATQRGAREGDGDVRREPGPEPVRQARTHILLVHDDRQPEPPRREVRRRRDVAAEADDGLGPGLLHRPRRGRDGGAEPEGEPA
jgi:hypothetical protein